MRAYQTVYGKCHGVIAMYCYLFCCGEHVNYARVVIDKREIWTVCYVVLLMSLEL